MRASYPGPALRAAEEDDVLLALALPAFAVDATRLQKVYDAFLSGGRVDYAALKAHPEDLDAWVALVRATKLASLAGDEKKAFLLDAYNAYTISTIVASWPVKSIMDLDGGKVWDTRRFDVGGVSMTLNELENAHLRTLGDPRIHAALNCASLGCPPLSPKAFTAQGLDAQLDAAAARWAATAKVGPTEVVVSRIFDWYGDDFLAKYGAAWFDVPGVAGKQEAAVNFVATYAPDKAAALRKGGYTVTYGEYSWALNGR
jgi:hypothetical protein